MEVPDYQPLRHAQDMVDIDCAAERFGFVILENDSARQQARQARIGRIFRTMKIRKTVDIDNQSGPGLVSSPEELRNAL